MIIFFILLFIINKKFKVIKFNKLKINLSNTDLEENNPILLDFIKILSILVLIYNYNL